MHEMLVGTWELVSWTHRKAGADVPYFGTRPCGLLVYTDTGRMSAHVMAGGRPRMGLSPEEVRRRALSLRRPWKALEAAPSVKAILSYFKASLSYVAYAGTYRVEGDEVVHHVELALVQDWVGTELRRRFQFDSDGDRLTLSMPSEDGVSDHTLTWARA